MPRQVESRRRYQAKRISVPFYSTTRLMVCFRLFRRHALRRAAHRRGACLRRAISAVDSTVRRAPPLCVRPASAALRNKVGIDCGFRSKQQIARRRTRQRPRRAPNSRGAAAYRSSVGPNASPRPKRCAYWPISSVSRTRATARARPDAKARRIRAAAANRHSRLCPESRNPSARGQISRRRRRFVGTRATLRKRAPLASLHGMPEACTRAPGRLADDQNARLGRCHDNRPRRMRQHRRADRTGANVVQQRDSVKWLS